MITHVAPAEVYEKLPSVACLWIEGVIVDDNAVVVLSLLVLGKGTRHCQRVWVVIVCVLLLRRGTLDHPTSLVLHEQVTHFLAKTPKGLTLLHLGSTRPFD